MRDDALLLEEQADIAKLRAEGLGAHTIARRVKHSKSTVQKYLAKLEGQAATKGHALTPATPTQDVPLDAIHLTFDTQARVAIDGRIVNEYAEAMAEKGIAVFPAVVLFHDAEGYWVGDGHHRCQAAQRNGYPTIQAEVRAGGPREAFLHAAGANTRHGHRRDALDARHIVMRLLTDEAWGQWSDREIARQCAVSHPYVGKLRAELAERRARRSGNRYQMDETRQVHRGEATYPMHTARIGTRAATSAPTNGESATARQARHAGENLYGREVHTTPCRTGYEESLDDVVNRALALVRAIEQEGGQAQLWQGWTRDRQQEFLDQVARIEEVWTVYAAEVRQVFPKAPLNLVSAEEPPVEAQP